MNDAGLMKEKKMMIDRFSKIVEAVLREKIHAEEYGELSKEYKAVRLLAMTRELDAFDLLLLQRRDLN